MIEVTGPPVDLNYRDDTMCMNTALHMAAANGHIKIVKMLLKQDVKTSVQNDTGNTPLHYAALNRKKDCVEALIEAKVDANVKNDFGRLPFEDALQGGDTEISEMLAAVSKLEEDKVYSTNNPEATDNRDEGLFEEENASTEKIKEQIKDKFGMEDVAVEVKKIEEEQEKK